VFHRWWQFIQWFISKPTAALTKHCEAKKLNLLINLERFVLSFKNTVEEEYVVHRRILQICSSAIHNMPSHSKSGP